MSLDAAAGAERELGERGRVRRRSRPRPGGRAARRISARKSRSCERDVDGAEHAPERWSIARRDAEPDRRDVGLRAAPRTASTIAASSASCDSCGVGRSSVARDACRPARRAPRGSSFRRDRPRSRARRPRSAGTLLRRMAPEEKPYRVYRGGRVKGKVPVAPAPSEAAPGDRRDREAAGAAAARTAAGRAGSAATLPPLRRPPWKRVIALGLLVLVALVIVWAVASYLAVRERREGREQAARSPGRAPRSRKQDGLAALAPDDDPPARHRPRAARGRARAPALRLDHARAHRPGAPPDLVPLDPARPATCRSPGSAAPRSTPPTSPAARRSRSGRSASTPASTINHVVIVDFSNFEDLIDAVGGITVDVPQPILSNKFDCPYKTDAQCAAWQGWRFEKGTQHMDGRRALIYSRIRENRLEPARDRPHARRAAAGGDAGARRRS